MPSDKQDPRQDAKAAAVASEPQAAAKSENRKEVRVITTQNDLVLVEWTEGSEPRRSWLPAKDVAQWQDGTNHATDPARGIPYGDSFLGNVKFQASADAVQRELRQRGIWTADDVLSNAQAVFGALQSVYGLDVASVLSAAAAYKREPR